MSTQRKNSKISICTSSRGRCYTFLNKMEIKFGTKMLQQSVFSQNKPRYKFQQKFFNYQNSELFGKTLLTTKKNQLVHCQRGPKDQRRYLLQRHLASNAQPRKTKKNHCTIERHVFNNVPDRTTLRENQPHIDTH